MMPEPILIRKINNVTAVGFKFVAGEDFFWSPKQQQVTYNPELLNQEAGQWALLHEAAHGLLGHQSYKTDYELLLMEVDAWSEAQSLATKLKLTIDPDHIQDCLDTYRDWLHERSTCPTCTTVCLQADSTTYNCHNCHAAWHVSSSRFCRPYRRKKITTKEKSPAGTPQTTFA